MLKNQSFWKYFLYVLTILFLTDILLDYPHTIFDFFSKLLFFVSLLALYGLSHKKPLGKQIYWKINFIFQTFFLILALLQSIPIFLNRDMSLHVLLFFITFLLILGLIIKYWLYGQYMYAFKVENIWNSTNEN